ncbi:MAG: dephospho-CoA kinase [Lachnospiraceae bacterium]|nr:dephospho-CoA kinase [Lachnospiraceae bacterium]
MKRTPIVIGLTGGVGSGKSAVTGILEKEHGAKIIIADQVSHDLMQPGTDTYEKVAAILPKEAFGEDGLIDNKGMAGAIFRDEELLKKVNGIIHPDVIRAITEEVEALKTSEDPPPYIVIETALIVPGALDEWCDTIWYVYVPQEIRIDRLMSSRNYTREKCLSIMASQPSEDDYRFYSDTELENDCTLEELAEHIAWLLFYPEMTGI